MYYLISFFAVAGIIIVGYFSMACQKYRNFKRFLKTGDPVSFYLNEERLYGVVDDIVDNMIIIKHHGKLVYKMFEDVYPVWGVRYEPGRED